MTAAANCVQAAFFGNARDQPAGDIGWVDNGTNVLGDLPGIIGQQHDSPTV